MGEILIFIFLLIFTLTAWVTGDLYDQPTPESFLIALLVSLTATLVTYGIITLIRHINVEIETIQEAERRQRRPQPRPQSDPFLEARENLDSLSRRHPREEEQKPRILLTELTLYIDEGNSRKIGRLVNPNDARRIRPVAVIEVNDANLAGRLMPIEFNLVGPRGGVHFECRLLAELKIGTNRIIPAKSELPISKRRTPQGVWELRIWAGNKEWGVTKFSISTVSTDDVSSEIGADMEFTEAAERKAEELAEGSSIDELLAG